MTVSLELADLQGLAVRGYGGLRAATFLLLRIDDPRANSSLARLVHQVTPGSSTPATSALNIAFSGEGLRRLGLPPEALDAFPAAFATGVTDPTRSRFLGDVGNSAPAHWAWGGPDTPQVDALLLIYGRDRRVLQKTLEKIRGNLTGLTEVAQLSAAELPARGSDDFREPFGFRDGISQPLIEGLPRAEAGGDVVRAGEFVLGYPNEYGLLTERPMLPTELDPANVLPRDVTDPRKADLGRNGSYLVLRQLAQDVDAFWRYLEETTRAADGSSDPQASSALAAKMVGRWPSGAPVVLAPDHDDPRLADRNDFAYHDSDPLGLACPLGAHVRRANPRDTLDPNPGSAQSVAVNHRHRIVRRSRTYDSPPAGDNRGERGLYFICLNGNLKRQFEFIQHTWLNNPNFNGLHDDADPLVGVRRPDGTTIFTEPAQPIRRRYVGLPEFVTVRGAGYFFLPGLRALRYLTGGTS